MKHKKWLKQSFRYLKNYFYILIYWKLQKWFNHGSEYLASGSEFQKSDEFKMADAVIVPNTKGKSEVLMLWLLKELP